MEFSRVLCTRRKEYTFDANGVRSSDEHHQPPVFIALPTDRQPTTEAERERRRIMAERKREQAILRAEEREAERQRHEQELQAVRRAEIQEAAQEIVDRQIRNLRTEFLAEISSIRENDEVEFIPIMPAPKMSGEAEGEFYRHSQR